MTLERSLDYKCKDLDFGVTTRAKISRFYGMEVAQTIIAGADGFNRWGFARGKRALISKIYGGQKACT